MTNWYTSDLHFGHPFVAALRGYAEPGWPSDATIREECLEAGVDLWNAVDWERHDRDLVDAINSRCSVDDTLTVLGDVSSGGSRSMREAEAMIRMLNIPRKRRRLVLGNHENALRHHDRKDYVRWAGLFSVVSPVGLDVLSDGMPVLLSHFPYRDMFDLPVPDGLSTNALAESLRRFAPPRVDGLVLLHGHTHAKDRDEFGDSMMLNVGVDAWDMAPVSDRTIVRLIQGE